MICIPLYHDMKFYVQAQPNTKQNENEKLMYSIY